MQRKLEISCFSTESAFLAERAGAHRIELCDNYFEGGTTPSYGTIKTVVEKLKIPVNVILRPRGGDFLYSSREFAGIIDDLKLVKDLGVNGVVVGFLKPNGEIDEKRIGRFVRIAHPIEVTFHRAFDMCKDPHEALEELVEAGVKRILTSGTRNTALDGAEMLLSFQKQARERIVIMPGAGINADNLKALIQKTVAFEFHSSAKTFQNSAMEFYSFGVSMNGEKHDEYRKITVDTGQIRKMLEILQKTN